ncbi:hypothetical protein [Micromonospora inyonensis]|uniref:Uncharacterized protein n=1 Tax=Micromonospora inyonensis TaxID=47866 RepID=A0A1C6S7I5_9ACTN|nr:hypothetical protein [Micromonospora inyonensis]SCL25430.1 hypothetical protein GA0074694_4219 [Micromonospora inyonensis]SCL32219.1 hypothetical protein GA0074694_6199 [Micromonospora inyonensis]
MLPDHPHADYIRRLVDAAPPLSEGQRSRLATILRPVADRPAPRQRTAPAAREQGAAAA